MKPFRASYQGGVSEEFYIPMVGEHLMNELTLRKFLGEVEKILNDKPITPLSTDPRDLKALTRKQILLLRKTHVHPQNCSTNETDSKTD